MAVYNNGAPRDDYYVDRGPDGKPLPSYWAFIAPQVIPGARQNHAQPYDFQAQHQQIMGSQESDDSDDDRLSVGKTSEVVSSLYPASDMDKVD